jgi:hypothetical protein
MNRVSAGNTATLLRLLDGPRAEHYGYGYTLYSTACKVTQPRLSQSAAPDSK